MLAKETLALDGEGLFALARLLLAGEYHYETQTKNDNKCTYLQESFSRADVVLQEMA